MSLESEEAKAQTLQCLSMVPEPEQEILILRFVRGMSHTEISRSKGITREKVRQLEKKGLRFLRTQKIRRCLNDHIDYYNAAQHLT